MEILCCNSSKLFDLLKKILILNKPTQKSNEAILESTITPRFLVDVPYNFKVLTDFGTKTKKWAILLKPNILLGYICFVIVWIKYLPELNLDNVLLYGVLKKSKAYTNFLHLLCQSFYQISKTFCGCNIRVIDP